MVGDNRIWVRMCLFLSSFAVRLYSVCFLQNNTTQKSLDYLGIHEPDVLLISLTQTMKVKKTELMLMLMMVLLPRLADNSFSH